MVCVGRPVLTPPAGGRVVGYSSIDQESYFTISRHGVTQVLEKAAEFVPLDEWQRDYVMFLKLRKVGSFTPRSSAVVVIQGKGDYGDCDLKSHFVV